MSKYKKGDVLKMEKFKVALVGQPNVGKSSLLNALVGPKVTVSNYPGTTVELTRARKVIEDVKITFIDTPGIYSISDRSEEEKITENILFEEKTDGVIAVIDATSLERSLYMVLQILEAKTPTIIALNFVEDAQKRGIIVDEAKLEKLLGVPVILINPINKKGITQLKAKISNIAEQKSNFQFGYDDHIEEAIGLINRNLKDNNLSNRFISIRILEEDEDYFKYLKDQAVINQAEKILDKHPEVAKDICITRYGTASFIAEKITQFISKEEQRLQEFLDKIFLHKVGGPILTGLFLLFIFGLLLYLGQFTQNILLGLTDRMLSVILKEQQSVFSVILSQGIIGMAAGISIALPYVFLFYLLLGLLEDVGLLSRFTINASALFKKMGLPAKGFVPLALGLGCTAPAIRSTKILSTKEEQFATASLFPFVPCSSRIAIIMGIVGYYGGIHLAFAVFATLIIAGLIWFFVMKRIFKMQSRPLMLELPPYRRPMFKNVLTKSWVRMKDFVYIVIPLLAVGGIIYSIFNILGVTKMIVEPFSFIAKWLMMPKLVVIPIIFGFLQKDLTGSMLVTVLGSKISLALTPIQIYTFGVATTVGIPCIIAFGMLFKEFGLKRSTILTLLSIGYGIILAGFLSRIISFIVS